MAENYSCLNGVGHGQIGRVVAGKLKVGTDLLEGIEQLVKKEKIKTGVILAGIGALAAAKFRNAKSIPKDLKMSNDNRLFVDINSPLELVSLSGWIATTRAGETNIHAHFMTTTVIDDKIVGLGGHLVKGTISSIKMVVIIGVIEKGNIGAALDPQLNQVDLDFGG